MHARNFQVPSLKRDLAWIAGAALVVAGLIGAAVGVIVDMLLHRHHPVR